MSIFKSQWLTIKPTHLARGNERHIKFSCIARDRVMTLLSLSPTFRHSLFVHPIPQSHGCYRLPFGLFLRYISGSSIPSPSLTFEKLGVARNVCAGLQEAYPEVVQPTETQSRLIPAVLAGKDVLLKDSTGSGK